MSDLEQIAAKKIAMTHDGWKRFGYKKAVLDALARWLDEDEPDHDLAASIFAVAEKYLPDLYKIDEDKKIIGLMEIEDYSKLRTDKLKAYSELWHDADFYGITIEIYTADRYGRNIEYLDLFPGFCHTAQEASNKTPKTQYWCNALRNITAEDIVVASRKAMELQEK